jgi:uncharacterized membrane protein
MSRNRKLFLWLRRLCRDRRASVLAYVGVSLPILIGAAGMSVDIAGWHLNRRIAQNIADTAAVAGALEAFRSSGSNTEAAAGAAAAKNGYLGMAGENLVVEYPPAKGPYAGAADAAEVTYSPRFSSVMRRSSALAPLRAPTSTTPASGP